MKTKSLCIVIVGFLVFLIAVPAHSWQGRMGGMGDPYGLVPDESDFLIHPAGIANGKGINFYGDYRFTWNEVNKWNVTLDMTSLTCGTCHSAYKNKGHEQKHQGLLGVALPAGPGRMGLFFQYEGKRGIYDGYSEVPTSHLNPGDDFYKNSFNNDLDSFALRLLYGLPMGAFKLGGEVQLAYHNGKNKITSEYLNELPGYWEITRNTLLTTLAYPYDYYNITSFFMLPYDSQYYEALFKGSLEGMIGPVKMAFTMRGGFIFTGDYKDKYSYADASPYSEVGNGDGKVKGWSTGGDLWVKYRLSEGLMLPFLLRVGYQEKTMEGDGIGSWGGSEPYFSTKIKEKNFNVEVGGGVDKEFIKGTRVAAGIYYDYLNNKTAFDLAAFGTSWENWDDNRFPDQTEHRITLRLLGERELSPMVAIRMGMSFFYGWVKEDFSDGYSNSSGGNYSDKISLNGYRWGIGASLGGTVKFQQFSLEPFIGGGYQQLKLNGNGDTNISYINFYDMSKRRNEWSIGGGLSIKFNP